MKKSYEPVPENVRRALLEGNDTPRWKLTAEEMPPVSVTWASMSLNKTGSWRYLRPEFASGSVPSCTSHCPAGVDVEAYFRLIASGKVKEAWKILKSRNPIPSVCGRVCYHTCEAGCNRGEWDESLAIHSIERWLGDLALDEGWRLPVAPSTDRRVAVVGSGPAGLAAAHSLRLAGHGVTIFEAAPEPGGVLHYGIPAYRLPKDVLAREIDALLDDGIEVVTGCRIGRDLSFEELYGERGFDAVFLAHGAGRSSGLRVEGEDLHGVVAGISFLGKLNAGEDTGVAPGAKTVVIGGGNTAIDCARSLSRLGAAVAIFYRRTREEMPAHPDEIAAAEAEGIRLVTQVAPVRVEKAETGLLKMTLIRTEQGEPDESGRRRPVPVKGSELSVEADHVVSAVGESVDLGFLPKELAAGKWRIDVDGEARTGEAGIFAGGDAAGYPRTVADAMASGLAAAESINRFLADEDRETIDDAAGAASRAEELDNRRVIRFEDLNTVYFTRRSRAGGVGATLSLSRITGEPGAAPHPSGIDVEPGVAPSLSGIPGEPGAVLDFRELTPGFSAVDVMTEVTRCFNCGRCTGCWNCQVFCPDNAVRKTPDGLGFTIDLDYCKGCGICVAECPCGALILERE